MIVGDAAYYEYLSHNLSWYYSENRWEYPIVADMLVKENPKVFLEVGCGAGHFLRLARSRGYEGHGCEMNPRCVEALRSEGFYIRTQLDHSVALYDALLMFQVLEHLTDPYSFLKSLIPHIQPGGIIVVSTPVRPSCVDIAAPPFALPPHHQWLPTTQSFTFLAERLGLVCERVLCDPPDCSQVVYALRKRCNWLPYSEKVSRHWDLAGWYTWRVATLMNCDWARVGHTAMALFRKPALAC
jgi:SAM-dependent methyltransferase